MVMNGVDLRTVGKILGHKSIQTTLRYAHLVPDYLKNAVGNLYKSGKEPEENGEEDEQ